MIDKNKPLPDHTKIDYYECYAKLVLEDLYPERFSDLVMEDKPDLQTNNGEWGIEVTNAIYIKQLEAENLYAKMGWNMLKDEEKASKRIEKCGCELEEFCLRGKPGEDSFEPVLSRFDNKLSKLNGKGYKKFKFNCLFIFSDIYANNEMIEKAIKDMQEHQMDKEKKFCKAFVLVPEECYCLNLSTGKYEIHKIARKTQTITANKAREIVEKYEKTE